MIHFIPRTPTAADELPAPYFEAVARLATIRQALTCVEQAAGQSPSARDSEAKLSVRWPASSAAARRCFDARSARIASGAAAGLEALALQKERGIKANPAATLRLAAELGAGLDELDLLFSL